MQAMSDRVRREHQRGRGSIPRNVHRIPLLWWHEFGSALVKRLGLGTDAPVMTTLNPFEWTTSAIANLPIALTSGQGHSLYQVTSSNRAAMAASSMCTELNSTPSQSAVRCAMSVAVSLSERGNEGITTHRTHLHHCPCQIAR
jgi:hypothetical protein